MSGGALYSQRIPLSGLNSLTSRRVINKQNLLTFQWGYHTNRLWAPSKSSTTQVYIISCVVFVVSRYTKNTSARKFVLQNQPVISRVEIFMIVSTQRISWKKINCVNSFKKKVNKPHVGFKHAIIWVIHVCMYWVNVIKSSFIATSKIVSHLIFVCLKFNPKRPALLT